MVYREIDDIYNPDKNIRFVDWSNSYTVGIDIIDNQNKHFIGITNDLYLKCLEGDATNKEYFSKTVKDIVSYIKEHFKTEEELLIKVKYPDINEHKKEHSDFVQMVIKEVKDYESGKMFVPNRLVRYMRDWVFEHIAISDKKYGEYMASHKDMLKL